MFFVIHIVDGEGENYWNNFEMPQDLILSEAHVIKVLCFLHLSLPFSHGGLSSGCEWPTCFNRQKLSHHFFFLPSLELASVMDRRSPPIKWRIQLFISLDLRSQSSAVFRRPHHHQPGRSRMLLCFVKLLFISLSRLGKVHCFLTPPSPWWSALKSPLCQESYKLHQECGESTEAISLPRPTALFLCITLLVL